MSDFDDDVRSRVDPLIHAVDLDGLVRIVDSLCTSHDWSAVLHTRDACRAATRTGRQVWPIATLCEYRLALHAPADWACRVVDDEASRFSIGPLTEVIAQHHSWSELRDLLAPGPHREIVAHERVIRGDRVDDDDLTTNVLDIPLTMANWEPEYPLAEYSDEGIVAPCPADDWLDQWVEMSGSSTPIVEVDDDEVVTALRSLVEPWTTASGGRARCIVVEGDLGELISALDRDTARVSPLNPDQALQWLAWCGASPGSHGRRRGSAAGRFNTWWLLTALAGVGDQWDDIRSSTRLSDELARAVARYRWVRLDLGERHSYELSLAVVDEDEGLTFGLFAHDDPL